MDALTPRGQALVVYEARAVALFEREYPGWQVVRTRDDQPAAVDGLIVRHSRLVGLYELKCRDLTHEKLSGAYGNEWLVTFRKLSMAATLARALGAPLFGWLYLIPDDTLLHVPLANANGSWACRFRVDETTTQATINGGATERLNAFIDLSSAKTIPGRG